LINLIYPSNGQNVSSLDVDFQVNVTYNGGNLSNLTIYNEEVLFGAKDNYFEALSGSGTQMVNWIDTLGEGSRYYFNATLCYESNGGTHSCLNSDTYLFRVDTIPPTITLDDNPTIYETDSNHSINYTVTDSRLESCYLGYDTEYFEIN